jgi:hypothetical protein
MLKIKLVISYMLVLVFFLAAFAPERKSVPGFEYMQLPKVHLIPSEKFYFNSFVDCNMAEAWIGDTFRIFPGKYGEDPLWGYARDLKFANGKKCRRGLLAAIKKNSLNLSCLPYTAWHCGFAWGRVV